MNYLLFLYGIYAAVMILITVWAGWHLHRAGRPFILNMLQADTRVADRTNDLLLVGYYLVNIGYSLVMLRRLPDVATWAELITALSVQVGTLVLLLSVLHYGNMLIIMGWRRRHHR